MGIANPGEPPQRDPQHLAEGFDLLWAESRQRAASRPGLSLDDLKEQSSRLRRMARMGLVPEHADGILNGGRFCWSESSRKAG